VPAEETGDEAGLERAQETGDESGLERATPRSRRPRWPLVLLGLVGAVVLALGMFALGRASVVGVVPLSSSPDAGFLRDMQTHHSQAVEMALIVRERSDDPEVRAIAYDIAVSQSQQSGVMYGWLQLWGLPQAGEPMAWMAGAEGHSGHGPETGPTPTARGPAVMPGMASREQLDALRAASGAEADALFLRLMIAHHEGGIAMARAAQALAGVPVVRALAGNAVEVQQAEVEAMTALLAARAGA